MICVRFNGVRCLPYKIFASACLVVTTTLAFAQDAAPITLRYDFARLAGKTAIYTIETELRQTVKHGDKDQTQGTRWRRDTLEQWYRRKGQSGRVLQKRTRIEIRVTLSISPDPLEYDSDSGEEPPEDLGLKTIGIGRQVSIKMTRRGQVTKVRGVRDPIERAGYAASFLRFPKGPVSVGDDWMRPAAQRVPYPPFGTLLYHTRYTLEKVREDGGFLIRAKIDVLFEPGPEPADGSALAKVHIDTQEAGGTLEFAADGLLIESRFRSRLVIRIKSGDTERIETATSTTIQRLLETLTPKQKRARNAKAKREAMAAHEKAKQDSKDARKKAKREKADEDAK